MASILPIFCLPPPLKSNRLMSGLMGSPFLRFIMIRRTMKARGMMSKASRMSHR